MYRERMRPKYTDAELAELYAAPHIHTQWPDHEKRVRVTLSMASAYLRGQGRLGSIADLSCGDGYIAKRLFNPFQFDEVIFGDFAPGYSITGSIEQTIHQIPKVGVFICCETIEHLDNPDSVLRDIRAKTDILILSTPCRSTPDENPEHYWAWDSEAVEEMLWSAAFKPVRWQLVHPDIAGYVYQIWICR